MALITAQTDLSNLYRFSAGYPVIAKRLQKCRIISNPQNMRRLISGHNLFQIEALMEDLNRLVGELTIALEEEVGFNAEEAAVQSVIDLASRLCIFLIVKGDRICQQAPMN